MKLRDVLKKHEITDEKIVNDIEEYVSSTLADKSDNMIPKSRFDEVIKERNELRADLSEKDGEIGNLNAKIEKLSESEKTISVLEEDNKNLKKDLYDWKLGLWKEKAVYFADDKFKDKAEKIKDDFVFPDEGKELTLEQIEQNLKQIKPYEKAEYFEQRKSFDGTKPKGTPPTPSKDPLDEFDK